MFAATPSGSWALSQAPTPALGEKGAGGGGGWHHELVAVSPASAGIKVPDSLITEDGCKGMKCFAHAMAWGFLWQGWLCAGLALTSQGAWRETQRGPERSFIRSLLMPDFPKPQALGGVGLGGGFIFLCKTPSWCPGCMRGSSVEDAVPGGCRDAPGATSRLVAPGWPLNFCTSPVLTEME